MTEAGFIGTSGCQARRGIGSAMGAGPALRSPLGLTGSGVRLTVPGGGGRGATTMATALSGTPARASACTTSGGRMAWAVATTDIVGSAQASSQAAARAARPRAGVSIGNFMRPQSNRAARRGGVARPRPAVPGSPTAAPKEAPAR